MQIFVSGYLRGYGEVKYGRLFTNRTT